jgi:hypothetical protein
MPEQARSQTVAHEDVDRKNTASDTTNAPLHLMTSS